jgi:transcriptional regulator with XRE-family HTH domain
MPARSDVSLRIIDTHIGARLRQRRTKLGLSQKQLGEACGVAYQQIAKYERAVDRIPVSRLYHLACFLQIPVAYFFEGLPASASRSTDATVTDAAFPSRETTELVAAYYRIADPKRRRAIARLIRVMSEARA